MIDNPGGSSTERSVNAVGTAATVIEVVHAHGCREAAARDAIDPDPPTSPRHEQPALGSTPRQSLHLSASLESSFANDETTWLGANLKICLEAGPVCAAARLRSSKVVEGLSAPGVERDPERAPDRYRCSDRARTISASAGFREWTGRDGDPRLRMTRETGAFRAETQQNDFDRSLVMVPPEPWIMVRAGVGLRYGR